MFNFAQTINNSEVNDKKFEFRNFNYEELLDKSVGQALLIKDYEDSLEQRIEDIINLQEKIEETNKKYYMALLRIDKLENSIFALS